MSNSSVGQILAAVEAAGVRLSVHGGRVAAAPARCLPAALEEHLLQHLDVIVERLGESDEEPPAMKGSEGAKWLTPRRSAPPRRILRRDERGVMSVEEVLGDA